MTAASRCFAGGFALVLCACNQNGQETDRAITMGVEPAGESKKAERGAGQILRSQQDGYSMLAPAGWTYRREKGAVVFTSPHSPGDHPSTIFVQSAPPADRAKGQTPESVMDATERAIHLLPQAVVKSKSVVSKQGWKGLAFELSYTPASGGGRRYDRSHVVLIGKRVLHIVHTAPAGGLPAAASEFVSVLDHLNEEG